MNETHRGLTLQQWLARVGYSYADLLSLQLREAEIGDASTPLGAVAAALATALEGLICAVAMLRDELAEHTEAQLGSAAAPHAPEATR